MVFLGANEERYFFEVLDGADQFHLVRMKGTEGISKLYQFDVEVVCDDPDLEVEEYIGQAAVITLLDQTNDTEDQTRYIHGIISRIEVGEQGIEQNTYYMTLVPKVWPLTYRVNNRIFQNQSVQQIIETILTDAGVQGDEYRFELSASLPVREYCVQYRESELAFIQRLMEDEGIHYYFEHEDDIHVLVMSDVSSTNPPISEEESEIPYYHDSQGAVREQHVFRFRFSESVTPEQVTLRDFDFKKPKLRLEANEKAEVEHEQDLEIYDYPGQFTDSDAGRRNAEIRLQGLNRYRKKALGESDVNRMKPGYSFSLEEHERDALNAEYLITHIEHICSQPQVLEVGASNEGSKYHNTFTCIPFDVPFRPIRETPRPIVEGTQTATVTGPSGEELYTDEFGRVKVQFHWDREGKSNEESSCWIRVSQPAAGAGFGGFFLPRIGEEVIVDFLEGDPDKPIVIGRVYHGANRPPYKLPDEKTKSTIKTNSSKGGGGFNEIRFEDKKGEEQLFVHAEKDKDLRIKNSSREWIGNNQHLIVNKNRQEEIKGDSHHKVKGEEVTHIEGNRSHLHDADLLQETKGSEHYKVGDQRIIKIEGDDHLKIAGALNTQVGSKQSIKAGQDIHVKAGTNLVMEAGSTISLKAGGSFITIGPSGVSISGPMVNVIASGALNLKGSITNINGGGSAGSAMSASPTSPALPEKPEEPEEAHVADNGTAGTVTQATDKAKPREVTEYSPQAKAMLAAAKSGVPFCQQCEDAHKAKENG